MDLTINLEDYTLNIRAGAIIIHNNKVLTHKNKKETHYALIGGRIRIGESSETAIKREIKEEMDKDIEITDYFTTIENFFEFDGNKFHEIFFVYKADFINEEDKKIEYTLNNKEGNENLQYEWLDIDSLNNYNLKPSSVKKLLINNSSTAHIIDKDN